MHCVNLIYDGRLAVMISTSGRCCWGCSVVFAPIDKGVRAAIYAPVHSRISRGVLHVDSESTSGMALCAVRCPFPMGLPWRTPICGFFVVAARPVVDLGQSDVESQGFQSVCAGKFRL